jgi:hypothetical protein
MFPGGYCAGPGVGGWLLMIGFWGLLIAVVVWAVTRLFPATPSRSVPGEGQPADSDVSFEKNQPGGPVEAERTASRR